MDKSDKPEHKPEAETKHLPDLSKLSPGELEALIAQKRLQESRQQAQLTPRWPLDELLLTPAEEKSGQVQPRPLSANDLRQERFRPSGLEVGLPQKKPRPKVTRVRSASLRLRDIAGYTLEGLVIVAVLIIFGNWVLQQFGISFSPLDLLRSTSEPPFQPSRSEGLWLSASAPGAIFIKAAATVAPAPEPSPTANPGYILAATPTPEVLPGPTATIAKLSPARTATPASVIAPTPTPAIVAPRPTALSGPIGSDALATIPARRLVIPRIGVDSPVKGVTVDLGNWQVADFAVGHHLGTANPGQAGNMVLAGHRDVRGSIFLRLNELQVGDEFRVYTEKEVYRYRVSEISEVAPSAIEVLNPTPDPTATLITCTPVGYATRRLIIRAKLEI